MNITSTDFASGQPIPSKFTCDGENINPELIISNLPTTCKSLTLIMDDPDAPSGTANPGWVHWILFNIPPSTNIIPIDSVPNGSLQGINDFGNQTYGGPCPHKGLHHYQFKIYSLSTTLNITEGSTKAEIELAMDGHVLDSATLVSTYSRSTYR